MADETAPGGWRWQKLSDYVAGLSEQDYVPLKWPRGGKVVYVHVLPTSVRKLYRGPVVITRHSASCPTGTGALLGFQRSGGRRPDAARPYLRALGD